MKKLILFALLMSSGMGVSAQWVTIPDANFANKLNELYPECMDGNQLNTACPEITNETILSVANSDISNLDGVQYFTNLEFLQCNGNSLSFLPSLPSSLLDLYAVDNNLTSLPSLPSSLVYLHVTNNDLSTLPALPNSLNDLLCDNNNLSSLPNLPNSLTNLNIVGNNITELPNLPPNLAFLICHSNEIVELPELDSLDDLYALECGGNSITVIPELPESLNTLRCANNNLTSLPELPDGLQVLVCNNNQIQCLPALPASLVNIGFYSFNIADNPFTCLPNYVPAMNQQWLSYPLCVISNIEDNPYGCASIEGIAGTVFKDDNTSCAFDDAETGLENAPLQLFDADYNLLASTYSLENKNYYFTADTGTYFVFLMSENLPFQPSCDDPGDTIELTLTESEPSAFETNFGVECLSGFDVGSQSIATTGWVFPGQIHNLQVIAGDITNWYNLQCAAGVSGSVTVNITGPVSYIEPAEDAIVPISSGDIQLTYEIDDFGSIDFEESFGVILETNTTAQADDLICVEVIVEPIEDDTNPENNVYTHCYSVVNSYDPNIKQVWPQDVEPGYDGYFNYTIYFQNTGTAPAFNIRVADTLDANLDLSTFQVTGYSHECLTYVSDNVATFRFNNIMLPDSTSDFDGSIGYVQYRIKAVEDLPVGTIIENTAHIYFDFNDAIVTNTTQNEFVITTSTNDLQQQLATVFPNPGTGQFNVLFSEISAGMTTHLEVYNLSGKRVLQRRVNENRVVLDLTDYPSGMYLLHVRNERGSEAVKLMKQ